MESIGTKNCSNFNCKQENPQSIEAFAIKKASKDGHKSRCKSCINEQEKHRPKTEKDKENSRNRVARYRIKHVEKLTVEREEKKNNVYFKRKAAEATARYRIKHADRVSLTNKINRENNREEINKKNRDRRLLNRERRRKRDNERNARLENKMRRSISAKKCRKNNLSKDAAKSMKRYAAKLQRIPKWITAEQLKEIENIYEICSDLQWLNNSNNPLQVDHIIPIQGANVSGLHVPWNLQILPRDINVKKGNNILEEDALAYKNSLVLIDKK